MKKIIRLSTALVLALFPLAFTLPSYATSEPDSNPSISNLSANVYLIESGDVLIYGMYDIPYAAIPDNPANDTYIIRLLDTDGSTQIGATIPFVRYDSGYNEGVFSFYFAASENLTIEQTYTVRISQNPAHFANPQFDDFVMNLSDWTSATSQDRNQLELTLNIISLAEELEIEHDVTLLESSVGGTVLSDPGGETYFRGAIFGIQAMAPDLFLVQSLTWDTTDREWSTTQFDTYDSRFSGTSIGNSTANISATLGLTTVSLMGLIYALPIIVGSVIVSSIKYKKAEPGYLVSALVLILLVLMGWINPALFATAYQLMAIYIGYLWFYSRS